MKDNQKLHILSYRYWDAKIMKKQRIIIAAITLILAAAGPAAAAVPQCGDANHPYPVGDLNHDCKVNFLDLAIFAMHWLERVNLEPVVYITEPPDGFEFHWLTESVCVVADAWDVDGSVVKVEFFVNGKKKKEDNDGSNGWEIVTNFDVGTYILTAKATDNEGATATSPPVTITAFGNICPEVYITQPEDGAVIDYVIDTMVIEAVASDSDGLVVKVAFALDGVKFCEDNDGTDGWRVCISPPEPGSHTLRATATDNEGWAGTSPKITFTVE